MHKLSGVIKTYDWGSPTAIPRLRGVEPSGAPEAELWFGTHPDGPARIDSTGATLLEVIERDPVIELGPEQARLHDGRLPMLMKIIAAEHPLSLQAHPSAVQARTGYAREEAAGIGRSAPDRNYRDASHKPELVVALSPFRALAGFRDPLRAAAVLHAFAPEAARTTITALSRTPATSAIREMLGCWMRTSPQQTAATVEAVVTGAAAYIESGLAQFADDAELVIELGDRYPNDRGVVAALLLNRIQLEPGDALFLPPGILHAYLGGLAVEVMASSDNVLRGGLTSKHIDVDELLRILDCQPVAPESLRAPRIELDGEQEYLTPAAEFQLLYRELDVRAPVTVTNDGPQIILCTSGSIEVRSRTDTAVIGAAEAAWVSAADTDLQLSAITQGSTVFRGSVPQ